MSENLKLRMWCSAAQANPDGTVAVTLSALSPTGVQAEESRAISDDRPSAHLTVLIDGGRPAASFFRQGMELLVEVVEAPAPVVVPLVQTLYVPPGFEAPSPQVAAAEERADARPEPVSPQYEDGGGSAQDKQEPQPPGG